MGENQESTYVRLLHEVIDSVIGKAAFMEIPWDFIKLAPKDDQVPLYLDYSQNYLYDEPITDHQSHLVKLLLTDTENFNLGELSSEQLHGFLCLMTPFLKYKDA